MIRRKNATARNQNGFTLVEVMVVVGILAMVSAAIATLTAHTTRSLSISESRDAKISLNIAVRNQLARKETCLKSLTALPQLGNAHKQEVTIVLGDVLTTPASTNLTTLKHGAELKLYSNLYLRSVSITNIRRVARTGATDLYSGDLDIDASSKKLSSAQGNEPNSGRFQMQTQRVASIVFETDRDTTTPKACYALSSEVDLSAQLETICASMGGSFKDGTCEMTASSGGKPCDPRMYGLRSGQLRSNPSVTNTKAPRCYQQLPNTVQEADVPPGELGKYLWMCPAADAPSGGSGYMSKPELDMRLKIHGPNGWHQTGPCFSRDLIVPPSSSIAAGSICYPSMPDLEYAVKWNSTMNGPDLPYDPEANSRGTEGRSFATSTDYVPPLVCVDGTWVRQN